MSSFRQLLVTAPGGKRSFSLKTEAKTRLSSLYHSLRSKSKASSAKRVKSRKSISNYTWIKTVHVKNVFHGAVQFLKSIPGKLWVSLVETFLIPRYRPEWGQYRTWDFKQPSTTKEDSKKKTSLRRSTSSKKSSKKKKKDKISSKRNSEKITRHVTDIPPRPVKHDHSQCIPVRINVSGQIFEPQLRTLKQFPDSLLGDEKRLIQFYDPDRNEYFFDRHRSCFEAILYFYTSGGILRRPSTVTLETFIDEIKFFKLGHEVLAPYQYQQVNVDDDIPLPKNLLKRKLWLLFDYPTSSHQSQIVASLSILAVCLSVFEFCVETLPEFCTNVDERGAIRNLELQDPFFFTETMCITFFFVEYVMRAITCPKFFVFLKEISNMIDLVSIMPYFINVLYYVDDRIGGTYSSTSKPEDKTISLTIFRIIRLVRVFRILKLSRHNRGLKILGKTLKASIRELGLLVFFLGVGVVAFSSTIYFAEAPYKGTNFTSIPNGFWFGVVTMTTLGYGDQVPIGPLGKTIGAICAIVGVLTISLPVPVIVSNFNMFYSTEDMNPEISTTPTQHVEYEHVEQCPYYPAWYTNDGQVVAEKAGKPKGTKDGHTHNGWWMTGEQKPDASDSDFDDLLQDAQMKRGLNVNFKKSRQSMKKPHKKLQNLKTQNK